MREFRYHHNARALDEELSEDLSGAAREGAVKAAEQHSKSQQGGGLERIAKGLTPLEEVKAILEVAKKKTAEQVLLEHDVRDALRQIVEREQASVDAFLEPASDHRPEEEN
jgi:hypothetical protein